MRARWGAAMALVVTGALGCLQTAELYSCADPCGNGQPGQTCDDPCQPCRGQCVPLPPLDFRGPALLWMGPEVEVPDCPPRAPTVVYEGHADLDGGNECAPCTCSVPACELPARLTASTLNACPNDGPGATLTELQAPGSWDGGCVSPGAVPASLLESVAIAPVTERKCAPVPPEIPHGGLGSPWKTFARACKGEVSEGRCSDPGMTCEPTAEAPPPGFRQCLMYAREGEAECPGEYPEKVTLYGGVDDSRDCTLCVCTQEVASSCTAMISLYHEEGCAGAPLLATMMDNLPPEPACYQIDIQGLGSMTATWMTNQPGTCVASGGKPVGEAKPVDPRTFCCQPAPDQSRP